MIVRLAELEIEPDSLDRYRSILAEEIEASVASEPGVLMLHAVSVKDSPTSIRILEAYADPEAYEAHLRSAHFLKYKSLTDGMVRALRLLEAEPIVLRAKS